MNKQYFRFLAANRKLLIGFFFAVYLSISLLVVVDDAYRFQYSCYVSAFMSMAMTYVLPVLLFSFVHRRSSSDVYFALPVSRKEIRITSILFAFAVSFGYFALSGLISWLLFARAWAAFLRFLVLCLFMVFALFTLLTVNSALFLLGNNLLDGIVILAAYTAFPLFALFGEGVLVSEMIAGEQGFVTYFSTYLSPFMMFLNTVFTLAGDGFSKNLNLLYPLVCAGYLLLGWYGLRREFDERKSERAEQISDHPLAYPLVINLYAVLLLLILGATLVKEPSLDLVVPYLVLLACYAAGTFLYQRKIQLNGKMIAVFLLEAVLCAGLMLVFWKTEGFGLSRQYVLDQGDTLVFEYHADAKPENLGQGFQEKASGNLSNVYFTLEIPVSELHQNQAVLDLLDQYRSEEITAFYNHPDLTDAHNLRIYNGFRDGHADHEYYYRYGRLLTEEELRVIAEHTDVWVDSYIVGDEWNWYESEEEPMRLQDYLNEREAEHE